uniref:SH3 domain-containing protein n=1 Tax=Ditylenchus dipsaci TaxID=166011 RepID=A0A915ET52_9BILA
MHQQQDFTGDLLDFSGAWPKSGHLANLLPDFINQTPSFNYSWSPATDMASSLEQHGNAESRGNVARLVDRLSKDITLLNNPSFKAGEVHLRKAGNPGGNGSKIAVVRFSYLAQQEDELDLKEGDELEVLEDVEDGWARVKSLG